MNSTLDRAGAFLGEHFAQEARLGFPRLRRIPSTGTIRLLDYFSGLTTKDRNSLLASFARGGAMQFFSPTDVHQTVLDFTNGDPALRQYRAAVMSAQFTMGLRYEGVRMRKAMLADRQTMEMMAKTRASLDFVPRDDMPAELVADPDPSNLKPAKAPLMRKLIDKAFAASFATGKRKLPGGSTGYTGVLQDAPITVWIDFGGMGCQLRYGASITDETRATFVQRIAYEGLCGAGSGWDYITEENAEASIQLLSELVEQIVHVRNGILALM